MKLFTVRDAAQILSISPWTVRAYVRSGKLRPVRVGRLVRLDEQELEQFISAAKEGLRTGEQIALEGK